MDETINIQIKGIYLERLLYWIIIVVLVVLLTLSYMKTGASTTKDTTQGTQVAAQTPPTTAPVTPPAAQEPAAPSAPKASCSDGIKNQDETATDCGGSCTKCGSGSACTVAADCIGGYCVNSSCTSTAPVVLSNKLEFTVSNVEIKKSAIGTVKVLGLSYKITNGLAEDATGYIVKVYVKNKAGTRCLNQQSSGTCDDSYAEFTSQAVKSGKTYSNIKTFEGSEVTTLMGPYLIADNGYDPTDSVSGKFLVVAYLYDDSGNQIGGKTISASYTVSP